MIDQANFFINASAGHAETALFLNLPLPAPAVPTLTRSQGVILNGSLNFARHNGRVHHAPCGFRLEHKHERQTAGESANKIFLGLRSGLDRGSAPHAGDLFDGSTQVGGQELKRRAKSVICRKSSD